jgi:hypothetical protein
VTITTPRADIDFAAQSLEDSTLNWIWIPNDIHRGRRITMKLSLLLCRLSVAVWLIAAFAFTAQGQTVIPASDDTYAFLSTPDSAMGKDVLVRVRAMLPSNTDQTLFRRAYLKFDLQTFSGTISRAELKLGLERVATAGYANLFAVSNDTWTETTLTWNNAPAVGALLRGQRFPSRSASLADTAYVFDVTAYVQSEFAGNKIVSFCLADDSADGLDLRLNSKETLTKPLNVCTLVLNRPATGVGTEAGIVPSRFELGQNYPNPFNPSTAISYQLTANSFVVLRVCDVLGREIATLCNEVRPAGTHVAHWDASGFSSGVYLCRLPEAFRAIMQTRSLIPKE